MGLEDLPVLGDDIEKIEGVVKRNGWIKTGLLQLQAKWLPIVVILAIGFGGYFQFKNEEKFGNINNKIQTIATNQTNVNIGATTNGLMQQSTVLATSTAFDPAQWIIDNNFYDPDPQGYYCPQVNQFGYWSMWTIKKFPLDTSAIKVRFRLKNNTSDIIPAAIFSFGEYHQNYSPSVSYELSIFDSNKNIVRAYDYNKKAHDPQYLKSLPDLNSDMVLSVYPTPSHIDSKISIDFELDYKDVAGMPQTYHPINPLVVPLENVDVADGSIQGQFGLGVQRGACIKPYSFETR